MLNRKIDLKEGSFSFSDYFKLNIEIDELLEEFGYIYEKKIYIKRYNKTLTQDSKALKTQLNLVLNSISLNSEIAVREFIIAPILLHLLAKFKFKLKSELTLYYDERLRGVLDYYIDNKKNNLVIIEAKNMDLNSGIKQLSMELITLDKLIEEKNKNIFGVVTIGTNWIFLTLDRQTKTIYENSKRYSIPEELDETLEVLSNIIKED